MNNDLLAFVKIVSTFSWYDGDTPQNYEDNKMTITHQIMINIPIAMHCRGDQYRVHVAINKNANTDHPRGIIRLTSHWRIDLYPVFNKSIKCDEKRHFMSMKTYVLWNYTMHRGINLPHDDNLCNCQHKSRRIGQF